jgi:cellulose synthase/poly-beta-1,6-N-acetylglucosamine synthase-like glycosyltransferase
MPTSASAGAALGGEPVAARVLRFSVIVPTYRRPSSLRECLLGLRAQEFAPDEVLVTVREDDLETRAELPQLLTILPFEVVNVERAGQTHALNTALARSSGDVVAFTDDDAVPRRDWLKLLAEQYADPSVGAVGGKLIVPQLTAQASSADLVVGTVSTFGRPTGNHHLGDGPPRDVQWLRGANMSFRREVCRFDESLRGSGAQIANDSEASMRVHAAGWRVVYVPDAAVFHNAAPRNDADQRGRPSLRAVRDGAFNELLVMLRWLPSRRRFMVATYLIVVGVPRAPGPVGAIRAVAIGRFGPMRAARVSIHATFARVAAWLHWQRSRGVEDAAPSAPH